MFSVFPHRSLAIALLILLAFATGVRAERVAAATETHPYLAWLEAFPGLDSPSSKPLANPAGDGLPNALKFLLGLDPRRDARGHLPSPRVEHEPDGTYLVLDIVLNPKAAALEALHWYVETSQSLARGEWETVGAEFIELHGADHLRLRMPTADQETRFFRLRSHFQLPALHIDGADDGRIYLNTTTPLIQVFPGYVIQGVRLNGLPFSGDPVTGQGLHELSVVAVDTEGRETHFTREFIVVNPGVRAPHHTIPLERQLVRWLSASPYVRPTASADANFVIGQSRGWPADPFIPVHDLHALEISDFAVDGPKVKVVLSDGNHPTEHTGSWGLRGTLGFLISDEPEAVALRRRATFFVYPMMNPDGRSISSGRSNPEMLAEGVSDHNRAWDTDGLFSTIDVLKTALRADTGGAAHYLLDYHSAGASFFYSLASMTERPLARAITGRDPLILPRVSAGQPGMMRIWSMSEEGLSVSTAYTPEFASAATAVRSLEIGRNYGLALHDLFTGEVIVQHLENLRGALPRYAYLEAHVEELAGIVAATVAADEERDVFAVLENVYRYFDLADALQEVLAEVESAAERVRFSGGLVIIPDPGYGALYQDRVARARLRILELLRSASGTGEELSEALQSLTDAITAYRRAEASGPFPPVVPREVAGQPATLTFGSAAEWERGFFVNTMTTGDTLMLRANPVLSFGGNGGFVETPFLPGVATLGQRFTWEFWKQYRRFASDTGSSGSSGNSPRFYSQIADSSGGLRTAIGDSWWTSTTLDATGEWYHIAFVFDEGEVRTYVNGELRDTRAGVSFSGNSTNPFTIGRGLNNARWLDGLSREHRIWSTARREVELLDGMHRRLTGQEAGLVAYWRLDEGSGSTALDAVQGRNGVIRGGSWKTHTRPGYHLSPPVRFSEVAQVASSRITWEASAGATDATGAVEVFTGISGSGTTLPLEWHRATNAGPIPELEGANAAETFLWLKTHVPAAAFPDPIRVHRLEARVE